MRASWITLALGCVAAGERASPVPQLVTVLSNSTVGGGFAMPTATDAAGLTLLTASPFWPDISGCATVYERPNTTAPWTYVTTITIASNGPAEAFSSLLALSGDGSTALIATGAGSNFQVCGYSYPMAFAFRRVGTSWSTWTAIGTVFPDCDAVGPSQQFSGVALDFDGTTAAVTLYADPVLFGTLALFDFNATSGTWDHAYALQVPWPGFAMLDVVLNPAGTMVLVETGGCPIGTVLVFGRPAKGSPWVQAANVTANDTQLDNGQFGWSLAISGDSSTAAIGAYYNEWIDGGFGVVIVYAVDAAAATLTPLQWVLPPNVSSINGFGNAVALSGDGSRLAVGESTAGSGQWGAVHLFDRTGGSSGGGSTWNWTATVLDPFPSPAGGDAFGQSVALSADGTAMVVSNGSFSENTNGQVYGYVMPAPAPSSSAAADWYAAPPQSSAAAASGAQSW